MRTPTDRSKATRLFFPNVGDRVCPACGQRQRYTYKSSGHHFFGLDGLVYYDGQIVDCRNLKCPLRFKPMRPPEIQTRVGSGRSFGFDVTARIGQLRFRLPQPSRAEIKAVLAAESPKLRISERQVENEFKLYAELVSGARLNDPSVIKAVKKNRALVLSIDGSKPIRGHDSVWFVRDVISGITLAALAMTSCTASALVKLLAPIKEFAKEYGVPVAGVVSDAESVIRKAVRKVFPRVRHQLCQLHYLTNLAKPLVKEDGKLREKVKSSMRGLAEIKRSIQDDAGKTQELSRSQAEQLEIVCDAIASVLRDNAKPPFKPPGLLLIQQLTALGNLVKQMSQEKGGLTFEHSSSCSRSPRAFARRRAGCASSTARSRSSRTSSSSKPRPPEARDAASAR